MLPNVRTSVRNSFIPWFTSSRRFTAILMPSARVPLKTDPKPLLPSFWRKSAVAVLNSWKENLLGIRCTPCKLRSVSS
ncbi:hypothetical protein DsansV1_C11g0111161 [Dioscorea sansibarensis]